MYALSPSQKKVLACPHRWYEKYIEKKRESQGYPAEVGTVTHECAAVYFGECMKQKVTHLDQAGIEETGRRACANAKRMSGINEKAIEEGFDLFLGMARKYRLNLEILLGIEQNIAVTADSKGEPVTCDYWDKEAILRGRIDLAEFDGETLTIVDWTTAWAIPDKLTQIRDYAVMGVAMTGAHHIRMEAHYIRTGQVVTDECTAEDARKWWKSTLRTWELLGKQVRMVAAAPQLRAKTFPAKAGEHCAWCEMECPLRTPGALHQSADMNATVQRYLAMRPEVKRLEAMVKAHVSQHGPFNLDSTRLSFKAISDRISYPAREVLALAEKENPILARGLSLSIAKPSVEKLMKLAPSLKEKIEGMAIGTPAQRFTVETRTDGD